MLDDGSVIRYIFKFYLTPLTLAGTVDLRPTREPFSSFAEKLYKTLTDFKVATATSDSDATMAIRLRAFCRRAIAVIAWNRYNDVSDSEYRRVRADVLKGLANVKISVDCITWPGCYSGRPGDSKDDYITSAQLNGKDAVIKFGSVTPPAYEEKVFVYDIETVDETTDIFFISAIKRAEGELEDIRKIKAPSRYLNSLIANRELQLASLVNFFDKRVKHDTARKDDSGNTLESGPEF